MDRRRRRRAPPLTAEQQELAAANVGLVYWVVKRMGQGRDDDALGAGHEGLVAAARNFDPAMGYQFSTYAQVAIRRRIGQYLAKRAQAGSVGDEETRQVVEFAPGDAGDDVPLRDWQEAVQREAVPFIESLLAGLSDYSQGIVRRYWFGGETLEGIARSLGITRSAVGLHLERARRYIRDHDEKRGGVLRRLRDVVRA